MRNISRSINTFGLNKRVFEKVYISNFKYIRSQEIDLYFYSNSSFKQELKEWEGRLFE